MEHRHPLLAGAITGACEIMITYPLQYLKTAAQIRSTGRGPSMSMLSLARETVSKAGVLGLYRGLAPNLAFALPRTGVRFYVYEASVTALGRPPSASSTFVSGLAAGVVEAATCVVPMTTIEVKMVDDAARATPQFKGLLHAVRCIVASDGVGGLYRGFTPTMLKLASNQACRFMLYDQLQARMTAAYARFTGGDALSSLAFNAISMTAGGTAGALTVFMNHPVDVVKSNMQALDGAKYRSSMHCLSSIWRSEGVRGMYKGTVPRLIRVVAEVSLTFTIYAHVSRACNVLLDGRE